MASPETGPGAVRECARDRLPDDRHQRADSFEYAQRETFVAAAYELEHEVRDDQAAQARPHVADGDPVQRKYDEVEVVQLAPRRRGRGGHRRPFRGRGEDQSGW